MKRQEQQSAGSTTKNGQKTTNKTTAMMGTMICPVENKLPYSASVPAITDSESTWLTKSELVQLACAIVKRRT
uniref:Uncharacterized protein n=1 Tax=Arion vulgaris TaxID=1028688 RepID=A0A0B7BNU6_9EUPU